MDKVKKRDRLEVIFDILKVVRDHKDIKPTPLLRYSNLSSQSFKEYYAELLEKELLTETQGKGGRKIIALTDKGYRFIEKYTLIIGFVNEFEL